MLVSSPALLTTCSGSLTCLGHPKVPISIQRYNGVSLKYNHVLPFVSKRVSSPRIRYSINVRPRTICASSLGRNHPEMGLDGDFGKKPFWLGLIKEGVWASRTLFMFLAEKPSQPKYIEWPSFGSTLRTATLTLLLVAIFIVALSSVDSALCYLLALFLRRTS